VVDAVESPEQRNSVAGEVPGPGPQIQQQDGEGCAGGGVQWQSAEQSDAVMFGIFGGGNDQSAGCPEDCEPTGSGQSVVAGGVSESRGILQRAWSGGSGSAGFDEPQQSQPGDGGRRAQERGPCGWRIDGHAAVRN